MIGNKWKKKMKKTLSVLAAFGFILIMSGMAMAAGTASGTMTVSATLGEACSVSNATMTFPAFSPFSGVDVVADTAGTLMINCTAGTTAPLIWSDTPRLLVGPGAATIAFTLGQTVATALTNALPLISTGEAIAAPFAATGLAQAVPLHGLIRAADYVGKAPGVYSAAIIVNVSY